MLPWHASQSCSPVVPLCALLERAGEPFAGQSHEDSPVAQGEVSSALVLAVLGSGTKEGSPVCGTAAASPCPC